MTFNNHDSCLNDQGHPLKSVARARVQVVLLEW